MNVENIWHVIDNEKYDEQYSGKWEEVPINDDSSKNVEDNNQKNKEEDGQIEENFALPGFSTNPGKGAENESRAIRTEPNYRFPYVNLKTFQMKNPNPPNSLSTSKKGNNMFYNLDNFQDVKNPVRGEAQEVVTRQDPIDRYNPAQPYLPVYGTKSKQSSAEQPKATKTVASLIPPPPPPQSSDSLLPPPTYDSFPPYAPPQPSASQPPAAPPVASKPASVYQPPLNADAYDSPPADGDDDDGPPAVNPGYRYNKPPSIPNFVPTLPPPPAKPFPGYSYDKPPMETDDSPSDSQSFKGYSYDQPPADSPPAMADKPSYGGYHDHPPSYGPAPPSYSSHDSDYPELIFNKPHGGKGSMKGGDDMKGNDMGMMPPPPPDAGDAPGPPSHDGFPQDFPGDFKYHDFDHDHDHYHYHHPTTTTTTTTETPRVNRYSYYYLGKKLYYLPLYFSVYFIVYVGALIIKAVLRHKIVYPNSWRPNDTTSTFFTKRSADWEPSSEALHDVTRRVTRALATAAEKYMKNKQD
ncbi:hypothetical protein JYU34_003361 [Plutella xylostella]|uniref:Uncharacterized protein n=1 Tax=Plutella xylostella TaxID=51655 RepID=A0ABQ7QZU7_PLUXY|nr:hypothetical protein JYU34_003361 [Plutella xylostella]